jgi:4-amino-4-deoxy-L-arabinose transferase-like glycosyltransferase
MHFTHLTSHASRFTHHASRFTFHTLLSYVAPGTIIHVDGSMTKYREIWPLAIILTGALALKAALLALGAVPFNADEAIVALMARHILQGERPLFFYGQAYMGSLDAYLVAAAFQVFGERVLAIRLVQVTLFAAVVATSYPVALRFNGARRTALLVVLLLAFPPVLLTLYTTASLGGYGEALLVGNILLWWGHRLGWEDAQRWGLWLAWGLVAGLGFWTMGLVLVYLVPVALWLLWRHGARSWRRYLLAALGFAAGSLPWWLGNLRQVDAGVAELFGTAVRSTATAGGLVGNVGARTFNFFVLGLPALFGLRFPWSVKGPPLWLAVPTLALYLGALTYGLRRSLPHSSSTPSSSSPPSSLLWSICGMLFLGFVLTPFGGDPSGRYFLPLYLPLFIFTAEALMALRERVGRCAWVALGAVLAFNLASTVQAASISPPGITTQLIDFLRAHDGTRGYTNYWVAYPIAFLSSEEIVLVPRLPYKADLRYTPRDDRYAPYGEWVEASPTAIYVTTNHSALDGLLREGFAALGVDFQEVQIGSYHVFYDLSRKVTPGEIALWTKE